MILCEAGNYHIQKLIKNKLRYKKLNNLIIKSQEKSMLLGLINEIVLVECWNNGRMGKTTVILKLLY